MKPKIGICLFLLTTAAACPAVAADDLLPKDLKGHISRAVAQGGRPYVVSWSIAIESQEPDGTVKGKFTFEGVRCRFADLAFTGTYREGVLLLSVPATSPDCGPWGAKLNKSGASGNEFEGTATIDPSGSPLSAFLQAK